jgi:predicted acylesterase/phospholipase RssA
MQPAGFKNPPQPAVELRLAVAFTGGVSLAVWMGGMAREMNLLLAASRLRRSESVADTTAQGRKVRDLYAALLELLNVDCSVDVISGTSAGGINAVILGLANVQRFDLDGLRELWLKEGSLSDLLRDPTDKQASSLLYGDKVLLAGLRDGLEELAKGSPANATADDDPTRVFITTTLLTGKASVFTDEYGTLVRDTDHHGLFSFTSAQLTADNVPALSLAARCSASFPLAFEPGFLPIGTDSGDTHPDMSPFTDATPTQFVADGGLLANRPLGPALQAVFDRSADREVRRVLAFVVPTVGGGAPSAAQATLADAPSLAEALAADLGAVVAQTISADLTAIATHNQQVRARNDARQQLAVLGAQMDDRLGALFYRRYRERRADSIARAASDEVMKRVTVGRRAPDGYGADARDAWDAADSAAENALSLELPAVGDYDGMNAAGREALDEGRATVLAVLRCAFRLTSSAQEKLALGALRARVSAAMPERAEPSQADTFSEALGVPPELPSAIPVVATPSAQAAMAADALLSANMAAAPAHQPWSDLATVVIDLRRELTKPAPSALASSDAAASSPDSPGEFVWELLNYLTRGDGGKSADVVAARLFDLHVARYVMQPDEVLADQALELVQMSSDTRTCLDRRTSAEEKLTGLALHHFGAFYKASWRANDWMWGRIDGAGWLVHLLLDPRRLHQLACEAENPTNFRDHLRTKLQKIAGGDPPPGIWEPLSPNAGRPAQAAEMGFLTDPTTLPTSLPLTATWVAAGFQRLIAGEELKHVVEQIDTDKTNGADEDAARDFLATYHDAVGNAAGAATNGSYPMVPEAKAAQVLNACQIPAEKIAGEIGSPLFARTVTRAAAVALNMVGRSRAMPVSLRPVLATAHTVTSLAYRVSSVGLAARRPLLAGLSLVVLGVIASTSTINLLNAAGLVAVLVGLLLVAVCAARRVVLALAVVTVATGAALAAAPCIPILRDHLFPWLEITLVPNLARQPGQWAILVIFVLLPPIWTIVVIIERVLQRRRTSKTATAAPTPTSRPENVDTSVRQTAVDIT